ncbi:MAG: cytidylate kinase-like family protein [Cyclobacteriaceae bacterium]|nr:cytidylate kinase-like family protein [Cyclobacteriaceae bacterium]
MSNVLLDYMKNRFINELVSPSKKSLKPGPVVTISRDYGCPAKRIAGMLSSALNRKELENNSHFHWHWIGKEILDESAKELNLNPTILKQIANKEQSGVVNEIVMSLSHKYYPGDQKIKKTIGEVIRTFAEQGHVIIVGRGGVSIARDIPDSLHIKLQAPVEWRINDVSKKQQIMLTDARRKIEELDAHRDQIRQFFEGKNVNDSAYDVVFNYMTLDEEDIVTTILQLMESKNLI